MDITFRSIGPWGAGKGANLEPAEVDNNFWSIAEAIIALQNDPSLPNGIASITVSGTQMTITLTDGTVMGPFTLPVLTFRWRGEFAAGAAYAALDVFTFTAGNPSFTDPATVQYGIFMVQIAITPATFDPTETVGGDPVYLQLFGSTDSLLSTLGDVEITDPLEQNDALLWDDASGKWVNITLGSMALQNATSVAITGGRITGMLAPVDPTEVATKAYADALPAGMTAPDRSMMANIAGAVAPAIPHTLSDFLDYALGTSTRGTLLYRGGTGWLALAPGVPGTFLQTLGAGVDPSWQVGASGVTLITAGAGITTGASAITATGSVALAAVADNNLLANVSGTSVAPSATTLTQLLDHAASSTRGSVLVRAGSGWVALAPGTTGYYLQTQGSTADPIWSSPSGSGTVTSISAGTGISTGGAPITGAGTVSLATIATASVLANISGSTAAPVPATVSILFDSVFGSTQGAIVYRNAATWVMLSPGTSGQVLTTGGAAANPAWAAVPAGASVANLRIISNISGSTAAPIGNTLSAIFDAILGSSRGMIVYRGSAGWAALGPGTTGQVLTTGGTAGDPAWAATATGASITVSDTPPASPSPGDAWWDGVSGQLYIRVNDGTSTQWVPASNQPGPAGTNGTNANISGMVAGQLPIAATATSITSSTATLAASFLPAYTGDVTSPAGSTVNTLATVPVAKGGTNKTSWTAGSVAFAASTTALGESNADLFWDDGNKRLGIGTAAPGTFLDVVGSGSGAKLIVRGGSGTGAAYNDIHVRNDINSNLRANVLAYTGSTFAGAYWSGGVTGEQGAVGTTGNYPFSIGTNNTARLTIDASGNVGIGTTGPGAKLDVQGSGANAFPVRVRAGTNMGTAGQSVGVEFYEASGAAAVGRVSSVSESASDIGMGFLTFSSSLVERVRITGAGGVIVGSPAGGSKGAGTLNAVTVYGNNVVLTSDMELKTDIAPLPAALPLVAAIEPKSFRWKPLPDVAGLDGELVEQSPPGFAERLNRGFIAQEVAQALGGKAEDGVDLGGLVAVLWQAVRELSDRVAELEGDTPAPQARALMINFPDTPTVGQIHTVGSASWTWDGAKWVATSGSGGGINQLTGDVTAGPGGGSQAATLANTAVTAGAYTAADITVDAKGRLTAAANGSGGGSGAIPHPGYRSQQWYTRPISLPGANLAVVANRIYAMPFYVSAATTFDGVQIFVGTLVAASSAELGIYANSGGAVGALVRDYGTVATATGSAVASVTGFTHALSAGWYFLAAWFSHAPSIISTAANDVSAQHLLGAVNLGSIYQGNQGWIATQTFSAGALPSSLPTPVISNGSMPLVALRAQQRVAADEVPLRDRIIAIERDVAHLLDESRAIRNTLHSLVTRDLGDHATSIRALTAAHDQRQGIWHTIAWVVGAAIIISGALAWLLEHRVEITIKP